MFTTETDFNMRVANLLVKWRNEAEMSQDDIAHALDVTRRTICNLESGSQNLKIYTVLRWAKYTNHDPIMAFPEILGLHLSNDSIKIMSAVINKIKTFREDEMRGIFFIFFGDHGSNLRAFIHLCVAYLKCPMRDKQLVTLMILSNYKNAKERNELMCPGSFEPDIDFLENAQEQGRQAFINNKTRYFVHKS